MIEFDKSYAFWRSFPIFEEFDSETLASLNATAISRRWPPDTVIFQRGDEGDYMIALTKGRIKLSLISPQGRELMLRQIEDRTLFGELAVLDSRRRSADATTLTECEGFVINKKAFMNAISLSPIAAGAIIRYLCLRLRDTTDQLETIALYGLSYRVARFFLTTLRQKYGSDLPTIASLKLKLSQTEIAEILGASRPKVNRAIAALEDNGGIRRTNGMIECNIRRLQSLAEPNEY